MMIYFCFNLPIHIDLAQQGYFNDPNFLNYLNYLQYWSQPQYIKHIRYIYIYIPLISSSFDYIFISIFLIFLHYYFDFVCHSHPHALYFLELLQTSEYRNKLLDGSYIRCLSENQYFHSKDFRRNRFQESQAQQSSNIYHNTSNLITPLSQSQGPSVPLTPTGHGHPGHGTAAQTQMNPQI